MLFPLSFSTEPKNLNHQKAEIIKLTGVGEAMRRNGHTKPIQARKRNYGRWEMASCVQSLIRDNVASCAEGCCLSCLHCVSNKTHGIDQ